MDSSIYLNTAANPFGPILDDRKHEPVIYIFALLGLVSALAATITNKITVSVIYVPMHLQKKDSMLQHLPTNPEPMVRFFQEEKNAWMILSICICISQQKKYVFKMKSTQGFPQYK